LTEDSIKGLHLPVFSEEKEVAMAIEQVPEEEFPYDLLFEPLVSPPPETDEVYLIEKYLKQLAAKEQLGETYVRDYVHDQKRRSCRPGTRRSDCATLVVFLSYLNQERGRIPLETITRDDVSSFIEPEQDPRCLKDCSLTVWSRMKKSAPNFGTRGIAKIMLLNTPWNRSNNREETRMEQILDLGLPPWVIAHRFSLLSPLPLRS
jgi:hypothetical protein